MSYSINYIKENYRVNYGVDSEYRVNYGVIDHDTDPATGQTFIFDGGYFRRDGVFIRNAKFERN